MSHIDTITEEVKPSSLLSVEKKEEINLEDIISFFNTNSDEYSVSLKAGRVYQTNKKLNLINTLFKMLQEEVEKIDSKNNKDLDKSFFNLNKKILSSNLYNIKEILKTYDIDEKRLSYFLLGTLIQYIYESRS
jgi:hypothetical protein